MFENVFVYDFFKKPAKNRSKRDWPVVAWIVPFALLVNWNYNCYFPQTWNFGGLHGIV